MTPLHITEAQHRAAGEFVDLIADKVGSGGRAVHPETAIASAAQLAGSLLLRSFELPIESSEPGTVVLSEAANENAPQLMGIVAAVLSNLGVELDMEALNRGTRGHGAEPQLSTLQSLALLQAPALAIAERHELSFEAAAHAAAMATGFIVQQSAGHLDVEIAFNVAALGFIQGSKTVPPGPHDVVEMPAPRKPWYRFW